MYIELKSLHFQNIFKLCIFIWKFKSLQLTSFRQSFL